MDYLNLRKKIIEKEFGKMNDRQFEAVVTVEGPLLVLAGAGSGKTTVLINRIANILRFGRASDSMDVPDTITEEDVHFLENLSEPITDFERARADYLCTLDPAAPWSEAWFAVSLHLHPHPAFQQWHT